MARSTAFILTGGVGHPFDETAPALAAILDAHGFDTTVTEDIEAGLLELGSHDLLVVHCLRWTMTQHEKYAALRAEHAFSLSEDGRAAIKRHMAGGGGLLGIHTASISFDDWDEWGDLLGIRWVWGHSHHPDIMPLTVRAAEGVALPHWAKVPPPVTDELYSDLALAPTTKVLLEARAEGGPFQPVLTLTDHGPSRAAYVAFGHDFRAFESDAMKATIGGAASWTARQGASTSLEATL
ncbi:MAG: ThuA domain-containing protein [Pseudomonadota bacterium]